MWKMMETVSQGFDAVMEALLPAGAAWAIFALSLATALVMVAFYKAVSPQKKVHSVKNRIAAHLLELRLFKNNFRFRLRAYMGVVRHNFAYMGYSLLPMLIMMLPAVLLLVQMNAWFGARPIAPGSTTLVTVRLGPWDPAVADALTLEAPPGVTVETPGVRVAERTEVVWRVRAHAAGSYDLVIQHGDRRYTKHIVVGDSLARTSRVKPRATFLAAIRYPGEAPLPADSPLAGIDIEYPSSPTPFLWWETNWFVLFFFLSLAWGLLLRIPMGVAI